MEIPQTILNFIIYNHLIKYFPSLFRIPPGRPSEKDRYFVARGKVEISGGLIVNINIFANRFTEI